MHRTAIPIVAPRGKSDDNVLPVLEYLEKHLAGTLAPDDTTFMRYPTRIAKTLGMRIVDAGSATASVEIDADPEIHGNQQGTVHGGLLCELADAAIGTAHSTITNPHESFATIDLKMIFLRPVWKSTLRAVAKSVRSGRSISHYACEIIGEDGKVVATALSAIMTLRGEQAAGR